jgi:aspartyl protease family protein
MILAIGLMVFLTCGFAGSVQKPSRNFADLEEQINYIAATYDIDIEGAELLKSDPARSVKGSIERQLKTLLADFNYVAIQEARDSIERVIILGRKQHFPDETVLDTKKKGKSHIIEVTIIGNNGMRRNLSLIVDTGSEYIVLPQSMISELGLEEKLLRERKLQTANGVVDAKFGQLTSIELGNETVNSVLAAFVDEKLLGGAKLLGMNVLRHFRFTLDDDEQTITLIKKDNVPAEIPQNIAVPELTKPEQRKDAAAQEKSKQESPAERANTNSLQPK